MEDATHNFFIAFMIKLFDPLSSKAKVTLALILIIGVTPFVPNIYIYIYVCEENIN